MKRTLLILLWMVVCIPLGAQITHRDSVLTQARYLKSIYRALASRIQQQYGLAYYRRQDSWDKAIEHYKEAYRYNPKFISALSTIAYCYEVKKDYKQALQWYEKYLEVARPGTQGYEFATKSVTFLKGELFMEEP